MTPRSMNKPFQIEWAAGAEAAENARTRLPKLITAYFAEGRKLLGSNPAPAELHALRLATKKVRYTLELFKSCYDARLEERISALKSLQQMLGEINDTVAGERTIEAALGARTPEMEKVARFLREQGKEKADKFKQHWATVFDAPGQQRWWTNYLAQPEGLSKRKPARREKTRVQERRPGAGGTA
jgi:CHAD domain-containing protein